MPITRNELIHFLRSDVAPALGCTEPVCVALCASKAKTAKALAFGYLVNRYINTHVGKLAPMCSCTMASSTAACAANYGMLATDREILDIMLVKQQ